PTDLLSPHVPVRDSNRSYENMDWMIIQEAGAGLLIQSWYHGLLSRDDAKRMLLYPGDFLIRQSSQMPGQVILSGRDHSVVQHVLLIDEQTGQVRTRDQRFRTIVDLVNFYYVNRQPINAEDLRIELLRPIPRK
ncbi:hypothetical protein PENTCL1PPCAC_20372, partial [Pristionchus entomophagus]